MFSEHERLRMKSCRVLASSPTIAMIDMSKANGNHCSSPIKHLLSLQAAAATGAISRLQVLLCQKKIDINELDSSGHAAVHRATVEGQLAALRLLIKQPKFDVNVRSKDGYTAIHLAVKYRRENILELLLTSGAQTNLLDSTGRAALHTAARKANVELVQVFLRQRNCNVNVECRSRATPLHLAISAGSYEICKLLIDQGANVYKEDIGRQTPLILAAIEKCSAVLQLMITTAEKDKQILDSYLHHKDHEGSAALHLAVVNNHLDNVSCLLRAGTKVNYPKDDGSTALHIAAMFGFCDITELLVQKGADLHYRTNWRQTPLHRAAVFDSRSKLADLVISNGADVNAADEKNMTPLHCAVEKGRLEMVRYLLGKGAVVDLTDDLGRSILHFSVQSKDLSCLDLLSELLPREVLTKLLAIKDVNERTALHCCAQQGILDILEKLLQLGASPADKDETDKTPIHLAAENGHPRCTAALFHSSKSEINDDDSEGCTPMLLACLNGHYSSVKTLLRFGADVAARGRDECNHTALTAAAFKGHLEIVDLLLDNGASIDIYTKFKDTALHLACRGNHLHVVELLLQKSASVTARNVHDHSPLDVAIQSRSHDAAAAIVNSSSWIDAMECVDEKGVNPLPALITFMPCIAKLVLDRCVVREGHPEDPDFSVTYNFKYIDPVPQDTCFRTGKAWYLNDMAEHECTELMTHELSETNIYHKWVSFARAAFLADFLYYFFVVIILSLFITEVPIVITDYEDCNGFPMIVTEEELLNVTIFRELQQNGTLDRFERPTLYQQRAVYGLRVGTIIVLVGTGVRLLLSFVLLRSKFFKVPGTYVTIAMSLCMTMAVLNIDETILVLQNYKWRAAWIGVLLAWISLTHYLIRIPVVGVYVTMYFKVVSSIVKTLSVLIVFFVAFAWCFSITLHRASEFETPLIGILTTMVMAMGEFSFVERFVDENTGPFYIDNLILFALFLIVMPIALVNLLIGVAVGDIDAVKSKSSIKFIELRIKTIDEYERYVFQMLTRKWHTEKVTIYPNRLSRNLIAKALQEFIQVTKRAVYQRSWGWTYHSKQQPAVDRVKELSNDLELVQDKMKHLDMQLRHQNELLMAIASKVGAELDHRGKHA